ncbi:hypothetical protein FJZ31_16790 [Candidatus Poribacteria bacterium]|nr:hypothetical protein [Candidatus Poribacteria bacterium]
MNCQKAEKKFSAYVENELDAKTRRQLEQHLEECASCAYELQAFQKTLPLVKSMPAIAPSSNFAWELRLRLAIEDSHKVSLRKRFFEYLRSRPAVAFSGGLMILLILSLGLYFYISPSKISTSNEFMVRYVMPEISPKEAIEQWNDFNPKAQDPPMPLQGGKQRSEKYLPELKEEVQPSHKTFKTNYVLRTVSFTFDNVNNPF